jgi:hypothetical protein
VTTKTTLTRSQFALLAITVAATIATHLSHLPPWLTPALALVVAARVWWRRGHEGAVAAAIRLPLALALLAAIVGEYGNVLGRDPGSAFGCGLLALKLLETETPRDARVVLGFCAFVLMSALLFEQSLPFTLLVCAVLVLQVAAFNRLEPAPLSNARPLRGSLALAGKLVLAAIPLALASFILVPRLGSPLWGSPNGNAGARTGLSDSMAPGQFTDLMSDDSPAFRVAFDGAPRRRTRSISARSCSAISTARRGRARCPACAAICRPRRQRRARTSTTASRSNPRSSAGCPRSTYRPSHPTTPRSPATTRSSRTVRPCSHANTACVRRSAR